MLVEALACAALWLRMPLDARALPLALGTAALIAVWISTAFVQVPCHRRLAAGCEPGVIRRLVRTNWVRTCAWTLRGGAALWLVAATPTAPAG